MATEYVVIYRPYAGTLTATLGRFETLEEANECAERSETARVLVCKPGDAPRPA